MEKGTAIGIGLGMVLIWGSIFMGSGWQTFFDIPSIVIVLGGTISVLFVNFSMEEVLALPKVMKSFMSYQAPNFKEYVELFTQLARTARREGLLALDRELNNIDEEFIRSGLEMAVDGMEETEIADMLNTRIAEENRTGQLGAKLMTSAGTYAPAFGMIGTLIGLIQMLQNLSDPSQIGAGMAVALITTFYGAFFANLIFLPIGAKIRAQADEILRARQMMKNGILMIVRGESPSIVEKKLRVLLPEDQQEAEGEVTPMAKAA